ncbi:MAG: hypoxanthine phosphoribosyltransferase [Clostridia bacterium]|nr:hypoxanthine phosphoribosyltransferase [Clostridia bacterium]MBO7289064.1 hypoxanthine phosphoribosyltransferase [Clostridia bacterium]
MSNQNVCEKILYSNEQITQEVKRLGEEIAKDYEGKEVIFVSVLTGAFMFVSDLVRNVSLTSYIDFMQVSTYENSTETSGNFVIKKDLTSSIEGKDVIVVEDILDTGFTLYNLVEYIKSKNPASVKIAAFIDKPARRKQNISADYVGFTMEDDYFIVGYGLDYAQKYRNLPYVGVLSEHLYK